MRARIESFGRISWLGRVSLNCLHHLDRQDRWSNHAPATDSLQTSAMSGKIDKFRDARLQSARAQPEKNEKHRIWNDRPKIEMGSVELPVNHHAQRDQTDDHRGGDETIAQPDTGQS